jgi:hypothetical protein
MIVVDVAGPKAAGWQTARKGSPAESSFPGKILGVKAIHTSSSTRRAFLGAATVFRSLRQTKSGVGGDDSVQSRIKRAPHCSYSGVREFRLQHPTAALSEVGSAYRLDCCSLAGGTY